MSDSTQGDNHTVPFRSVEEEIGQMKDAYKRAVGVGMALYEIVSVREEAGYTPLVQTELLSTDNLNTLTVPIEPDHLTEQDISKAEAASLHLVLECAFQTAVVRNRRLFVRDDPANLRIMRSAIIAGMKLAEQLFDTSPEMVTETSLDVLQEVASLWSQPEDLDAVRWSREIMISANRRLTGRIKYLESYLSVPLP